MTSTAIAFQFGDGVNTTTSPDLTLTQSPTRVNWTFTTGANIVEGFVAIVNQSSLPAGSVIAGQLMLVPGTSPPTYNGDTNDSRPPGGGGAIIISYGSQVVSMLRHVSGVLVPESTLLANQHTNAQLFEQFVPFPIANPTYVGTALDGQFTSTVTVGLTAVVTPGRGQVGTPVYHTLLDSWNDGATDPGTFSPFTTGNITGRFFKSMIALDIVNGPVSYISALNTEIDSTSFSVPVTKFIVDAAGTILTFPNKFHAPPNIQVTPADGNATSGGASQITSTQAMIQLFKGGTEVSGVANIMIVGA